MNVCNNCNGPVQGDDALRVAHKGRIVAALCALCVSPAAKARITLAREEAREDFHYEQYVCIEALDAPE